MCSRSPLNSKPEFDRVGTQLSPPSGMPTKARTTKCRSINEPKLPQHIDQPTGMATRIPSAIVRFALRTLPVVHAYCDAIISDDKAILDDERFIK